MSTHKTSSWVQNRVDFSLACFHALVWVMDGLDGPRGRVGLKVGCEEGVLEDGL